MPPPRNGIVVRVTRILAVTACSVVALSFTAVSIAANIRFSQIYSNEEHVSSNIMALGIGACLMKASLPVITRWHWSLGNRGSFIIAIPVWALSFLWCW